MKHKCPIHNVELPGLPGRQTVESQGKGITGQWKTWRAATKET
jgi:hypothetical protein